MQSEIRSESFPEWKLWKTKFADFSDSPIPLILYKAAAEGSSLSVWQTDKERRTSVPQEKDCEGERSSYKLKQYEKVGMALAGHLDLNEPAWQTGKRAVQALTHRQKIARVSDLPMN